jgi:hypothetical protein
VRRHALAVAACAAGFAVLASCGKKGAPLAPLRPQPARIADLSARAVETLVQITVIVPAGNADGTTPSVIEQVEVYALAAPPLPGAPTGAPPAAPIAVATIVQPDNLVGTAAVGEAPAAAGAEPAPARLTMSHDVSTVMAGAATPGDVPTMHYVAIGVGRGRRGQPSLVVEVPLGQRPAAPDAVAIAYDESSITVSWSAPAAGVGTHVDESGAGATGEPVRRSVEPAAGTSFSVPVTFGERRCFTARHVVVAGGATVEGPASPDLCVTPADRFPPPAPGSLAAIAEDGAVILTWRGVEAADLAGYVVLRGEGAGETLQPLTSLPVAETSYRDETSRAGVTYTYAVVAVDRSEPPNRSAESNRQTVTARD